MKNDLKLASSLAQVHRAAESIEEGRVARD
jgi:hypothetical protein